MYTRTTYNALSSARWFTGAVTKLAPQWRLSDSAREGAAVLVLHGHRPGGQVNNTKAQDSRIT